VAAVRKNHGLSLVDMMVAILVTCIVILAIGVVFVASHRGWRRIYNKMHSVPIEGGYVARESFDKIVRQCYKKKGSDPNYPAVGGSGNFLTLKVAYDDPSDTSTGPDRYALFAVTGTSPNGILQVTRKVRNSSDGTEGSTLFSTNICGSVSSCKFAITNGKCVQMALTLDDGKYLNVVTTTSCMALE